MPPPHPLHIPTLGGGWLGRQFSTLRMESEEVGHHDRLDLPTGLARVPPKILQNPETILCGRHRRGGGGCSSPRSPDRKSTRLNSSHLGISYAVFCLKK